MKTIILITSLLLISCDEPGEYYTVHQQCSGTIIEEMELGVWEFVKDCEDDDLNCCEYEGRVSCGDC